MPVLTYDALFIVNKVGDSLLVMAVHQGVFKQFPGGTWKDFSF